MPRKPTGKRSTAADGTVTVRGKAGNGEGSVYFDGNRWRATYWVAGEKRPRRVSAATRDKALARRAERVAELADAAVPSRFTRTTTVGELAQWWLDNVQRHQVRASTWAKAEDRVRRIRATLGSVVVRDLGTERVVAWQSSLLAELAPKTVAHHRQTLAQVLDQAVALGLAPSNPVRRVKPPRVPKTNGRALTVEEVRRLVAAAGEDRYGGVVALLFLQGWRVSEALGLSWDDLDLHAATAQVRRASIYIDGQGQALGPTKTSGAMGEHQLVPTAVALLRRRRDVQDAERLTAGDNWSQHLYEGRPVELVFTTATGGLVLRQTIAKSIERAAGRAGIDPHGLATHAGRRSVVTALYAEAGESIDEIARFVGHASPATTAGYVGSLGDRPTQFARRAAALLDPANPPTDTGQRSHHESG